MKNVLTQGSPDRGASCEHGDYGFGSVLFNPERQVWQVRLPPSLDRKYLGAYPTYDEGWRVLMAFWEDYEQSNIADAKCPTLGSFGLGCIEDREVEGIVLDNKNEKSRWRTYVLGGEFEVGKKQRIKYVVERDPIADLPVTQVDTDELRAWLERVGEGTSSYPFAKKGPRSRSTLRHALQLMRTVLKKAVTKKYLKTNPGIGLELPENKRQLRRARRGKSEEEAAARYTEQELVAFWTCEEISYVVRLWHKILVGTGMRGGEFAEALFKDLHLEGESPYLYLRDTKNGRPHKVPLFGIALEAMREWVKFLPSFCKNNELGLLWPGEYGGRRSTGHWWGRISVDDPKDPNGKKKQVDAFPIYLKRAGITRHFRPAHDCRHTCATALLSGEWGDEWPLEAVQKLLNHSDLRTTQRYAKKTDKALERAAKKTIGPRFATTRGLPPTNAAPAATGASSTTAPFAIETAAPNAEDNRQTSALALASEVANITSSAFEKPRVNERNVGGAPQRIRTSDLRLRRPTLYPAELVALVIGGED